tara:strand:+ start:48 stop:485 length:438 start_codon:yes stop_codon:yes gene_type:complete
VRDGKIFLNIPQSLSHNPKQIPTMSTFRPNNKVVCIDSTPIPIGSPNTSYIDFEFPEGYIQEGAVYCVRSVVPNLFGQPALFLVGPRAVLNNQTIPWNGQRFRKVNHRKQKAKRSAKKKQPQKITTAEHPRITGEKQLIISLTTA